MKVSKRTKSCSYPRAFICTFCKQEFETMGSVFDHMSEMHSLTQKNI